jgi:hypothetical protein
MKEDEVQGMVFEVLAPERGMTYAPLGTYMALGLVLPFVPGSTFGVSVSFTAPTRNVVCMVANVMLGGQKVAVMAKCVRNTPFTSTHVFRTGKALGVIRRVELSAFLVVAGMSMPACIDRLLADLNAELAEYAAARGQVEFQLVRDIPDAPTEPAVVG